MKVLCVNCVISEFGGVEFAAMNLARALAARGHEVHFLGAQTAKVQLRPKASGAALGEDFGEVRTHYRDFPRIYPLGGHAGALRKLIWHLQDLGNPANERLFAEVLAEVQPDILLLHNITAVGLNIWRPIARMRIPCIQVIHDLNPICMNMSQFRGGKACDGVCLPCAFQKKVRFSMIDGADNFVFVAPSRATLETIQQYVDLTRWRCAVIPNANTFLVRPRTIDTQSRPELLYVGRIDPAKGVEMMLQAASQAAAQQDFVLHVLGAGSLEQSLRARYAGADWVVFHGSVPQERVAAFMAHARVLLVPSLWFETVPGVAVHALYAGLPVLGSRMGGIPEHVFDGETGRLLPPGDTAAWAQAICDVLRDADQVERWSSSALARAPEFDAHHAVTAYEKLMHEHVQRVRAGGPAAG
jgi:glycosyltransferase involved in cell wall biosynthesis